MRKICVITGTRAEYGLLRNLMLKIKSDKDLQLQVIATNMHLSPEFGLTYTEIEKDHIKIDKKIEMLLSSDSATGTVKSMGVELIGLADAFSELNPDILVILGDRYEMLVAAEAALIFKIPVAHLYGGDKTEGAYDDSIRNAITKLSHLHFTSTEDYRKRVIQMGENPEHVFYVGALGVDNILHSNFMSKRDLEKSLNFKLGKKSMLVTFHAATMEDNTVEEQFKNLLHVLDRYVDYNIIFTYPNSDNGGVVVRRMIDDFVSHRNNCLAIASLGRDRFYSVLDNVDIMIGNSSSGLVEAPLFGIPTLNIGDRQKGRKRGCTVVDCRPEVFDIESKIQKALSPSFRKLCGKCDNPYYKKGTADSIFRVLKSFPLTGLIKKSFYDLQY